MTTKGICIFAQNNNKFNYVEQAYFLAKSIKKFNPTESVCIITNDDVSEYESTFDHVVRIEQDDTIYSSWRIENRAKVFDLTPYDETIVFDSDVLLTHSTADLWSLLDSKELYFTTEVINHRGNTVTQDTVHRKTFIENNLPNIYSAFFYFKSTDKNKQFFDLLKSIVENYQEVYKQMTPNSKQQFCSIDVSIAICCKLLDVKLDSTLWPVIHMKTPLQDLQKVKYWADSVLVYANDDGVFINNYKQNGVLHYVEKNFTENESIKEWILS